MTEPIIIHGQRQHNKASERYVDVTFQYEDGQSWSGLIPIEYRRTGIDLINQSDIESYLEDVYDYCHPNRHQQWKDKQDQFWATKSAKVTENFFRELLTFQWRCVRCQLPNNPNYARRIQDLKEMGYTIATDTSKYCTQCQKKQTHLLLVPLPRGGLSGDKMGKFGYETWSPQLRKKIIEVLNRYDAYEGKQVNKESLLPDHKFPEIRWDQNTKRDSLQDLTEQEIKEQFQLLSNQRNLQKREVCRQCYQTGIRGHPFGIKYYYQGAQYWPSDIPQTGKDAETGCIGCGWYDLEKWRVSLNQEIEKFYS